MYSIAERARYIFTEHEHELDSAGQAGALLKEVVGMPVLGGYRRLQLYLLNRFGYRGHKIGEKVTYSGEEYQLSHFSISPIGRKSVQLLGSYEVPYDRDGIVSNETKHFYTPPIPMYPEMFDTEKGEKRYLARARAAEISRERTENAVITSGYALCQMILAAPLMATAIYAAEMGSPVLPTAGVAVEGAQHQTQIRTSTEFPSHTARDLYSDELSNRNAAMWDRHFESLDTIKASTELMPVEISSTDVELSERIAVSRDSENELPWSESETQPMGGGPVRD